LYQYNLVHASSHYLGLIQTESVSYVYFFSPATDTLLQPYFQPKPASPTPFFHDSEFQDPTPYAGIPSSWAVTIRNSREILIFGKLLAFDKA